MTGVMLAPGGAILTVNTGSSTIKLALFDARALERLWASTLACDLSHPEDYRQVVSAALAAAKRWLGERALIGVGHRIVHGGAVFDRPVLIDALAEERLARLVELAPLHMPLNLEGLRLARLAWPDAPQIAVFDTAFHRTMPDRASRLSLPRALSEQGVKRFGFHGLSYECITGALRAGGVDVERERIIIAHLGAGASMCALAGGQSIETTMGFSTLSGLPMATRCGDLDPGALLYLMRHETPSLEALERLLYHECGLRGVSGLSGDMKTLLAHPDDAAAKGAVDFFCYQARRHIGALAAALAGLDRLVFTGGVGAHSAEVRERICEGLGFLGVTVDPERNRDGQRLISTAGSRVAIEALATDEELMIARHVAAQLAP